MRCPTCGDEFDSQQGVRIHHTRTHGVSLPNRTCKGCGEQFYDPDSQLNYCDCCNPSRGRNNGNWNGGKETTTCKICDNEFEYYPSNKDGVYCPTCVEETDEFLGEPHRKRAARVEKSCEWCGETMEVLASRLKRDGQRFCSQDCHGSWLSENVVGENHHQWQGGTLNYGGKWWEVRRDALKRDDHSCQRCGRTKEVIGREPDVHHIERVREFENPQNAHKLDNVVCLCRRCHRLVESGAADLPLMSD